MPRNDAHQSQDGGAGSRGFRLPGVFHAADAVAQQAQLASVLLLLAQLALTLAGIALGLVAPAVGGAKPLALAGAVAFATVGLLRIVHRVLGFEARWTAARAVAETTKTLAWRYGVRAEPFEGEPHDPALDARLLGRIQEVAGELQGELVVDEDAEQITEEMRALRSRPLDERRRAYDEQRLADQLGWYTHHARKGRSAARSLEVAFYAFTGASVVAGILFASGIAEVNLSALTGAVAGGALTWLGGRSYTGRWRTYAGAALELSLARERAAAVATEADWSQFVVGIEDVFGHEQTRWRLSRS